MNLAALASLTRLSQMGNLSSLGMMPGGLLNPGLGVPGSLAGLPTDMANFSGALGPLEGASGSGGSSGTYGSSSGSGGSGGSGSGDVTQDAAARAKKLGMEEQLTSGGSDEDEKKMIKEGGCETKEVNSPDQSTIKTEMSKPGVTGGVLNIPGHAVEINPGGDGGSAASSAGKGKQLEDKQQGPNGTDGGCWACSSTRASNSNNKHDLKIHDSGDGVGDKDLGQFAQENQIESLIVSIKKGGKSSAA